MKFKTTWKEFIAFMGGWLIPSQTPIYIILTETMHYPILLAYIVSALSSGIGIFCLIVLIRGYKS